ncbi:hypothetical protein ACT4UT_38075, partial [Bacillus sp. B-TM1]
MKDTRLLFSIGSFNVEVGKLITFTICSILLWGTHIILTSVVRAAKFTCERRPCDAPDLSIIGV